MGESLYTPLRLPPGLRRDLAKRSRKGHKNEQKWQEPPSSHPVHTPVPARLNLPFSQKLSEKGRSSEREGKVQQW